MTPCVLESHTCTYQAAVTLMSLFAEERLPNCACVRAYRNRIIGEIYRFDRRLPDRMPRMQIAARWPKELAMSVERAAERCGYDSIRSSSRRLSVI